MLGMLGSEFTFAHNLLDYLKMTSIAIFYFFMQLNLCLLSSQRNVEK